MSPSANNEIRFREIVRWPLWLWFLAFLFNGSIILIFWAAFDDRATSIVAILLTLSTFYVAHTSRLTLEVSNTQLRVGKASIEKIYLGEALTLNRAEMRYHRGPGCDATAYLAIRFWIPTGIRIEIADPRDPTPYWLVSSKNFEKFATALKAD